MKTHMELAIRTRSIEINDTIRELIVRRLQFALDAFGDRIEGISVYLSDVNGPRGGVDKSCQLTVGVRGLGVIPVKGSGPTTSAALSQAARRLKYRISEALRHVQRPVPESIRTAGAPA